MINLCLALRPDAGKIFRQLDAMAVSGDYDVERLQQLQDSNAAYACRESAYYLASLFLHSRDNKAADNLLTGFSTASSAMKRYYHVLAYARRCGYPVPRLNPGEARCLDFLEATLNPASATLESVVLHSGGFTVAGNAPGAQFKHAHDGTRFYFNNYKNNDRISKSASVHVVTPSFKESLLAKSNSVCITGNDCFYRRSRVWKKFTEVENCTAVYTLPAETWSDLYKELGTSPSAGLLVLFWLERLCRSNPGMLKGYMAGFSDGYPESNHSYDAVPPSARHNWEAETVVRQQLVCSFERHCSNFALES